MKKILITGANSYVGISLENYLKEQFADRYCVDTVDMIDGSWRQKSFAGYDTVFHVAGIVHTDAGKISAEREALHRKINTELTLETAQKAKAEGVGQFIFMSSASVYGDSAGIGQTKMITAQTPAAPTTAYGSSKLAAEEGLKTLVSDDFHVVVLRPPMIYGKGCKGNYPTLEKLALKLPVFPKVENARSMLYIGNLVEFVRLMVENNESGLFWPQNAVFSNTSEVVSMIARAKQKKIRMIPGFGWALKLLSHLTGLVNKAFGNFTYDLSLSEYREDYRRYSLTESIEETEK